MYWEKRHEVAVQKEELRCYGWVVWNCVRRFDERGHRRFDGWHRGYAGNDDDGGDGDDDGCSGVWEMVCR